jgi:hypothetical protein
VPATGWARSDIGRFFASNHLSSTAVTPVFVLVTVGSLVVVTIGTALRTGQLQPTASGARWARPVP